MSEQKKRIVINYSIEEKDFFKEVKKILAQSVSLWDQNYFWHREQIAKLLEKGETTDISAVLENIVRARDLLEQADIRFEECHNILLGYKDYKEKEQREASEGKKEVKK